MRKIVSIDTDARYFPLFQAALKSFLRYNPGWEVHICDCGMSDAQREEVSPIAKISAIDRNGDPRWPTLYGRFETLADYQSTNDALLLHIDADTLTFGSIEPAVAHLLCRRGDISFVTARHAIAKNIVFHDVVRRIFPSFDSWKERPSANTGVTLARSHVLGALAAQSLDILKKHGVIWRFPDQDLIISTAYESGAQVVPLALSYNYKLTSPRLQSFVLTEPPIINTGERAVIAHVPSIKREFFAHDSYINDVAQWWMKIVRRYEVTAWPTGE